MVLEDHELYAVDGGDEQGHGRDHGDQRRERQAGHGQEDEDGLALRRDDVELPKGRCQPDHARQRHEAAEERAGDDPEYVAFYEGHAGPVRRASVRPKTRQ